MKKRFWILLLLLALLTGCTQPQASAPENPDIGIENGGGEEQEKDPVKTTPALLEQAEAVGTAGNLWYIANEHIETLDYPFLYVVGEDLLAVQYQYDADDDCTMLLKLLDLDTGELLAERSYESSGWARVQVMEDCITLSDAGKGWVRILSHSLQLQKNYELDGNWGDWIVTPDLKNVYEIQWEYGFNRINLEMQVRVPILEAREINLMHYDPRADQVMVSYLDATTLRYVQKMMDMNTYEVIPFSLPVDAGWAVKDGDIYFISEAETWDRYHLFQGQKHWVMELPNAGQVKYLWENQWLYTTDMESRSPSVYALDGKRVSTADLPGGEWVNNDPVWCEAWGGYFFTSAQEEGATRLLFWDPKVQGLGEDLPMEPYTEPTEKTHTVDESLYQQAQALMERFGVDIRIAEQCALDYDEFTGQALTDSEEIRASLQVLERALGNFPEGFFEQLLFSRLDSIRLELIYGLKRKDWPDDAAYTSFSAFAQDKGNYYLIVIDVHSSGESTYYHELSHVIDRRLSWDTIYRKGALYSEETWLQMQPQGFDFSYDYQRRPDNWEQYLNWFVDDYSMTMPTEDRARVLEYAMAGWSWSFSERPNLIPKLEYYGKCIRDCFDTTGWPAQTAWEQALEQAKQELIDKAA